MILIEIYLNKNIVKSDLVRRNILTDTIEHRNLGKVIEETSSISMMEVVLQVSNNKKTENYLKDLLVSLDFSNYKIHYVSNKD